MRVDSERALQQAITAASKETKTALSVAQSVASDKYDLISGVIQERARELANKISVAADPHLRKAKAWYTEYLKETVDSSVIPFYRAKVVPVLHYSHDLWIKGWPEAKKLTRRAWDFTIATAKKVSQILLDMIEDTDAKKWMPDFVVSVLKYAESSTEDFVILKLQIFAVLVVCLLRFQILNFISSVLWLPFRIMCFFCPLRFFVQGKKASAARTKSEIKTENVSSGLYGVSA